MKKELVVVQKNSFIRGEFTFLEVRDLKILKLLVSKVNATNKEFEDYYYITKDEVRAFKFNERNIHSYIKRSLRKLSSVFVVVKNDDKEEVEVSLVGKIIYDKKNGIYKVPLSEDLKEYLLDIKDKFTKYKLENLVHLKRKEEIKLYEYLKSISFEIFVISIDNLKTIMEINKKSFDSFFNFHKKLKDTIISINSYTDINVSFKILKSAKQDKNIQFTIKRFEIPKKEILSIEILNLKYENKNIMLNNAIYTLKNVEIQDGYVIASVLSKELNLLGKLKFYSLEDCDGYFKREIVIN
ncbi:replication initiation protein [Aliarcobacter thereius]|uniref:replication initiation protein n=1 Tax=Aliarcobacter thereius TaxID=544718 RepID=UPI000824AF7F|nr:replication initiation protein [Aliarcobacter thereius]OCL90462.1 Initiator Replication protein [Aliarcobacter thereius]